MQNSWAENGRPEVRAWEAAGCPPASLLGSELGSPEKQRRRAGACEVPLVSSVGSQEEMSLPGDAAHHHPRQTGGDGLGESRVSSGDSGLRVVGAAHQTLVLGLQHSPRGGVFLLCMGVFTLPT